MKRTILLVLLAASLSMNVAVGGTVLWNLLRGPQYAAKRDIPLETSLDRDDLQRISAAWPRGRRAEMMEIRRKIGDKKLEVLELISKNPGDLKAADEKIDELIQLRGQMERKALTRISEIMGSLPEEKRTAFLGFLRNRACMGHGMMGRGMRHGIMRHGMGRGSMGPDMGRGRGMGPTNIPCE
ncbi:MAG: periplasmic heavy metal sensor [Pseudomonadota bacterium]